MKAQRAVLFCDILPAWRNINLLLERIRILVARRGGDDLEMIKTVKPFIAWHWDRFEVFDVPTEIGDISSSAFQDRLHNSDRSARELVTEEVWKIMDNNGKVPYNGPHVKTSNEELMVNNRS